MIVGCDWDSTLRANRLESLNYYLERGGSRERVDMTGCNEQGVSNTRAAMVTEDPSYVWYANAHSRPSEELVDNLSKNTTL